MQHKINQIIIAVIFSISLSPAASFAQVNFESSLQGIWVQYDYIDHNQKFSARYGNEVLPGGLYFNSGLLNVLDGMYYSKLVYTEGYFDDPLFTEKSRYDFNNETGYKIKDSILYIKRKHENYYSQVKIKKLDNDTLILYCPLSNYEERYCRKYYSNTPIKVNTIEYYSGPNLFGGQVFSVRINNYDDIFYKGKSGVDKIGTYRGNIEKSFFDDIIFKINLAGISELESNYSSSMTDAATKILKVNYNDTLNKSIEIYGFGGTVELRWIMIAFYSFEKKANLIEVE